LSKMIEDGPGDYIFTNSLPDAAAEGVRHLLDVLRIIKSAACDVSDTTARANLASIKEKVTLLVCHYERYFPRSEVCRISHIMLHNIDMVGRWNSVRNYWCFITERYPHFPAQHRYNRVLTIITVFLRLSHIFHGYNRVAPHHRFVGWLTNFIHNRSAAGVV
jgi:hypothetical protein